MPFSAPKNVLVTPFLDIIYRQKKSFPYKHDYERSVCIAATYML